MDFERDSQSQVFILSVFLSILFHFILFSSLKKWAREQSFEKDIIEVTYRDGDEDKKRSRIIIKDPEVGPITEEIQKKISSRFLSKFFRQVEEETVAKRRGEAINNTTLPSSPSPLQKGEGEFSSPLFRWALPNMTNLSVPFSGLKEAHFTVLNTERFKHYIFFNRIVEQIGIRLRINLLNYFKKLMTPEELRALWSKSPHITRLEAVFTSEGHHLDIIVHRSSGFKEVDYAAIDSIIDSSPLLNPPDELIQKDDGKIHIHYSFYLW